MKADVGLSAENLKEISELFLDVVREQAMRCNMHFVTNRWLGGTLTNFSTIRKSVKRLTNIEKMETDGTFDKITKKERLMLDRMTELMEGPFSESTNRP